MSEILIVAEQVDSHVSKPTLELLTLARRLGEPVAVVFSETDEAVRQDARGVWRHSSAVRGRPGPHGLSRRAESRSACADRRQCGHGRDPDQLHPPRERKLLDGSRSSSSPA